MRVVREINNDRCKITVFNWNAKYLIKLEQGDLEQTYKVDEMDILAESDIDDILNETFISEAVNRFREMNISLAKATEHL
ncbi:MAG: hypothetical protein ABJH05_01840 [Fulvivirga sp.]